MIQPSASLFRAFSAFFFLLFSSPSPSALLFRKMYFNIMEYIKQLPEMLCIYPPCSLDLVAARSHSAGRDTLDIYIQLTPKEAPWWKELNINQWQRSWIKIFPSIGMFFLLPVHSLPSASVHFSSFLYQGSVNMQGFHTERKWRTCKHAPAGSSIRVCAVHAWCVWSCRWFYFLRARCERTDPVQLLPPCFEAGGRKKVEAKLLLHLLVQDERRIGSPAPKKQFCHLSD